MALKVGELFARIGLDDKGFMRGMARMRAMFTATAKLIAKGAGWGALGIHIAGATVSVLAMIKPLLALSGLLAAVPAFALAAGAAFGALKIALSGFDELMERQGEAWDNAGKSTRAFVNELHALKPAWQAVVSDVREGLFGNLVGQAKALAGTYLPILRENLTGIARAWGAMAKAAATAALDPQVVGAVNEVLGSTWLALGRVGDAIGPLVLGLGHAFAAANPFVARFGAAVESVLTRFGTWLQSAGDSGQLTAMIEAAIGVLKQLGTIAAGVGGILNGIFDAAASAGGDVLGVLGTLLQTANAFINSAAGQAALGAVFGAITEAARILNPVLADVLGVLGGLLQALAPILPVAAQLISVLLSGVAGAVTALLPVISELVTQLSAALGPVITQIAAHFAAMMPLIGQLVDAFMPLVGPIIGTLGSLLSALLPVLSTVAGIIAKVLTQALVALAPVFARLLPLVGRLAEEVMPQWIPVVEALGDVLLALMPALIPLIDLLVKILVPIVQLSAATAGWLAPALATLIGWIAQLVTWIAQAVGWFASFLGAAQTWSALGDFFVSLWEGIKATFNGAVAFIASLPGRIWDALAALPGLVARVFTDMVNRMAYLIGWGIGTAIKIMVGLPPALWRLTVQAFQLVVTAVANGIRAVVGFVQTLPGRIGSLVSSAWNRAKTLFAQGIAACIRTAKELPGKVASAISGLRARISGLISGFKSTAVSVGRAIIDGMISGVKRAASALVSAAKNVVGNAIKGAKDALGIGSPSKVAAREIGRWIPPGIGDGFRKALPALTRQLDGLMPSVLPLATAGGPAVPAGAGQRPPAPVVVRVRESGDTFHLTGPNVTLDDVERHQRRKELRARSGRKR